MQCRLLNSAVQVGSGCIRCLQTVQWSLVGCAVEFGLGNGCHKRLVECLQWSWGDNCSEGW